MSRILFTGEKPKSRLRFGLVLNVLAVLFALELTRELQQSAPGHVVVWAFVLSLPALCFAAYVSRALNPLRVLRANFIAFLALFLVFQALLGQAFAVHGVK